MRCKNCNGKGYTSTGVNFIFRTMCSDCNGLGSINISKQSNDDSTIDSIDIFSDMADSVDNQLQTLEKEKGDIDGEYN
jgi:DnaJ-class molecular chaperone